MLLVRHLQILFAAGIVVSGISQPVIGKPDTAALRAKYEQLSQEFTAANPSWRPKAPASGSLLFVAPDEYSPAERAEGVSDARIKYADALFELATEAADAGQLSLAFQWATETVRENPDHAEARRVLGYEQRDGQWLTPYGVKMAEAGKMWDAQRGWVAANDPKSPRGGEHGRRGSTCGYQERLASAHRSFSGDDESQPGGRRRTGRASSSGCIKSGGNCSPASYYTEKEVRGLFAGERNARTQIRPFRVFYHRDRDEYVERTAPSPAADRRDARHLLRRVSRSALLRGRRAGCRERCITRPCTSCFRNRSRRRNKSARLPISGSSKAWPRILKRSPNIDDPQAGLYFTIGESTAGRLPAARERMRDGFYVPLAELTQLGKDDVQRHAEIAKLYSQSSGLAAFLMDGEQGRYREPLVRICKPSTPAATTRNRWLRQREPATSELDAAVSPVPGELAVKRAWRYRDSDAAGLPEDVVAGLYEAG